MMARLWSFPNIPAENASHSRVGWEEAFEVKIKGN
jgi:hypothetical protein